MLTVSYRKSVLRDIVGEDPFIEFLYYFILHADGVPTGLQFLRDLEELVALLSGFMSKDGCLAA